MDDLDGTQAWTGGAAYGEANRSGAAACYSGFVIGGVDQSRAERGDDHHQVLHVSAEI